MIRQQPKVRGYVGKKVVVATRDSGVFSDHSMNHCHCQCLCKERTVTYDDEIKRKRELFVPEVDALGYKPIHTALITESFDSVRLYALYSYDHPCCRSTPHH